MSISGAITIAENGNYIYPETWVEVLERLFDQYLSENPDKVTISWIPTITENNLKASWFGSTESYYKAMSVLKSHDLVAFWRPYNNEPSNAYRLDRGYLIDSYDGSLGVGSYYYSNYYTPVYFDLSDVSLVYGSDFSDTFLNGVAYLTSTFGKETSTCVGHYAYFINSNGLGVSPKWHFYHPSEGLADYPYATDYNKYMLFNSFFTGVITFPTSNSTAFVPVASSDSGIGYMPIFSTSNAYKDWITGNGAYYRFNSGYAGGALTIDPNADYSAISGAIADAMKQGLADGAGMSEILSLMQSAFSDKLDEINNTLGDISDNTSETNSWLEKIYNLLVKIDKKVNGILVADTVDTAVNVISKLFDSIWEWISNKLEIVEMVQEVGNLGNVLKKKFPFSIPWDVYAILLMFDAPAKPPVISLHFEFPMLDDYVYDYEYIMDGKEWVDFATVCRFFLTIGYEISLMHLTQKLYASGLFDMPAPNKRRK
ncbi:MAG: hypothetical protein NC409_11080 [Clostridium sp.]|nr:hypothetical protein [Clostridium sp.]